MEGPLIEKCWDSISKQSLSFRFETEPSQSSRMKVRSESMWWLGFKSWGEMLEYYIDRHHMDRIE